MIGGRIISIDDRDGIRVVTIQGHADRCAVRVAITPDDLGPGDHLWWQGRVAYWTPETGGVVDKPISRIGYSTALPTRGDAFA